MKYTCMKNINSLIGVFGVFILIFSACKSEDIAVPVQEEPKPTAVFTIKQVDADDPFTFAFTNQSANFKEVRWEFGDDSSSLEISPTHTFLKTGTFRVKLLSQNGDGYWAQKETLVKISPDSIMAIEAKRVGNGTLDLSFLSNVKVDSLFWYRGIGTGAVLFATGDKANIAVATGKFQDYTLRVKTPKGSIATISRLLTDIGIVKDITNQGNLTVSRDNNGGPQANEGSLKLVDNNPNSKFLQFDYKGDLWLQLEYYEPQIAGSYTFTSANDASGRDPKNWTVQGSNNGTTWTTLDTRTDQVFESRFLTKTFIFPNTTPYLFYRINVTAVGSGTLFQMAEWRLLQLPQ